MEFGGGERESEKRQELQEREREHQLNKIRSLSHITSLGGKAYLPVPHYTGTSCYVLVQGTCTSTRYIHPYQQGPLRGPADSTPGGVEWVHSKATKELLDSTMYDVRVHTGSTMYIQVHRTYLYVYICTSTR